MKFRTSCYFSLAFLLAAGAQTITAAESNNSAVTAAVTSKATLTSPTPGSTLTGSSATFTWSAGTGASNYKLTLGTSAGGSDVYNSYTTAVTSKKVSGIPTNGATLYATLWSEIGTTWSSNAYTYTEYGTLTPTKATLTTPAPSSTLTGSSATFSWTAGSGVSNYKLTLGTTAGGSDVYNSYTTTVTSKGVSGIPTTGATLYATLWSEIGGAWSSNSYTYTEYKGSTPTAITPYILVAGGTWTVESSVTVNSTSTVVDLGPQPISGGSWSWSGPNSFTSTSREIDNIALSAGTNTYTATYTNASGAKSTQAFTITVAVPTAITPYMQVNGGAWTVESSVTVASGATVNLGPQPISGGSWSWSGPNSFTSTSREIDNIALSSGTNTYTATYTNASGAKSTQAFTVTVGSSGTLPCDIYASGGTPCVAAHSSTRALFAAYDGPLYQVQRSSDSSYLDIGLLATGGYANSAAQDNFCSGTSCTVTKIYDQSSNKNDLTVEGTGGNGYGDTGVTATNQAVQVGGHMVYSLYFNIIQGYRNDTTKGIATNGEPEGVYMVTSGTHVNNWCCFDYGNAETSNNDTGNAHMDAVNFSTECWTSPCYGSGPWVQGDLENGLFQSNMGYSVNTSNTGWPQPFVTAILKNNGQTEFALRAGNAQSGGLTTEYDGGEPNNYAPFHQEGAIVLGTGGDNSNFSVGTFFEGAMTYGYPTDATEDAVQANIVSAGYSAYCNPTNPITPYISVSGNWTVESSATVNSGTAVSLGPQPTSGTWSWAGPNNFTSTSREIDNIALSSGVNTYTATYTDGSACSYKQAFKITVN